MKYDLIIELLIFKHVFCENNYILEKEGIRNCNQIFSFS
jgi:hypothetical protein